MLRNKLGGYSDRYAAKLKADNTALRERVKVLEQELRLWRSLVVEGGVPRYTVTPGAALNTIVTSTDSILRRAITGGGDAQE